MKLRIISAAIMVLVIVLIASCGSDQGNEQDHQQNQEKLEMIEKKITISYTDVYVDGNIFFSDNRQKGSALVPIVYENTVYLPIDDFVEDITTRTTTWDAKSKTVIIEDINTERKGNSLTRYPDIYPREINVSYGGITLMMDGEEIELSEEEQLLVYEDEVFAPAELLGRVFERIVEWRTEEITASYGTFDYQYLFMGPPLSSKIEMYSNKKHHKVEANIQPTHFEPEPPAYLDIELK